jgi:hypothetical protein
MYTNFKVFMVVRIQIVILGFNKVEVDLIDYRVAHFRNYNVFNTTHALKSHNTKMEDKTQNLANSVGKNSMVAPQNDIHKTHLSVSPAL